ncbi:hypothetical protein [Ktedonospora formicarum]|uniref:N-acetyltransferase domain-containing protein n=1 Tax=Ktedonospora formicarum TaxID=2778364 RepID=A0A8J3HX97_9CHLR|nr:hypothetical protein [Ktedonospora formicarum]GHO42563.1 hypothetical protein KSX_07260 [Ktedonospora formicarum]
MRIRHLRYDDIPEIVGVQQESARVDGTVVQGDGELEAWLRDEQVNALANGFVITDDDDELSTWSQAGTLEGITGEIIAYTVVCLERDEKGYHFICRGTVTPSQRRRRAGRLLLVGALNRAREQAFEFEFEAEQEGLPLYFEVLLPSGDMGATHLAALCELEITSEPAPQGLQLYSRTL